MPTDRRYTSQPEDASGLLYYGARYYDPQIGQFISPDTIVPDEKSFLSYNRYLYANGNPLKYNDPSGHQASCTMGQDTSWDCNDNVIGIQTVSIQEIPASQLSAPPEFSTEQLEYLGNLTTELAQAQMVYADNGDVDWQETLKSGLGEILSSCGKVFQGACGISLGGSGAVLAVGGKVSLDVVVDQYSDAAIYFTAGGGGYAVFSGFSANGRGASLLAVHNATINDLNGWSVQFGGSVNVGTGASAEWIAGKNSKGEPWHGAILSTPMNFQGGYGAEVHATATYSWQWWHRHLSTLR
jgi:RHS repeat-associated protein